MPFQQITYYRAYLVQNIELALCSGHYPKTETIACFDTKTEADTFCTNLIKATTLIGDYGFYSEYRVIVQDYQIEPSLYISPTHQKLINQMSAPEPDSKGYYEAAFIKPEEGRAVFLDGNNSFRGAWVNGDWEIFNIPGSKIFYKRPAKWKYAD